MMNTSDDKLKTAAESILSVILREVAGSMDICFSPFSLYLKTTTT
jgi:hypothetical protein